FAILHPPQARHRPPPRNQSPHLGPLHPLPTPLRLPQLRIDARTLAVVHVLRVGHLGHVCRNTFVGRCPAAYNPAIIAIFRYILVHHFVVSLRRCFGSVQCHSLTCPK